MCTGKLLAASAVVFALTGLPGNGGAVGANLHEGAGPSNHVLLLRIHGCHGDWQDGWIPQWNVKLSHRHGGDCQPKAGGKGKHFKNREWQPWLMPDERRSDEGGYDRRGDGRYGRGGYDRPDEGGYDSKDQEYNDRNY